jgi:hypothetical protein
MTITAQAADEPDRDKALADIADALTRLGHQAEPVDEVARELAELRKEVAALRASQAIEQHCHNHCWCSHIHWNWSTHGAAGGYIAPTWTYNSTTGTNAVTTNYAASTGGTTYYLPSGS